MFRHVKMIPIAAAAAIPAQTLPFACEKKPLEGTAFSYQIAVAEKSRSVFMRAIRDAQPELPTSGDKRSGMLVFDGDTLIASNIYPAGPHMRTGSALFVQQEYRGRGIAHKIEAEFIWHVKRCTGYANQYTLPTTLSMLAAHKAVVLRAVQEGMPVPEHVLAAVTEGAEAASMLAAAQRVQGVTT
jgi:GNAT superfamily N-acetyltransferase